MITHSKTRSNPENNVALMTLSDLSVLVTLTTDTGKILAKLHQVNPAQDMKFVSGIKIAHLCLKHRQGKNHKTRIIAFVGYVSLRILVVGDVIIFILDLLLMLMKRRSLNWPKS